MKAVFALCILTLLSGCAGMQIEAKGFSPGFTAAVMRTASDAGHRACKNGVVSETREAHTDVRTGTPDPKRYPDYPEVRVEAKAEIKCR